MSADGEYDYLFKLLLIGDSGVGKSSILLRFVDDRFEEDSPCTIGVDFKVKRMQFGHQKIQLTLWDTAGQEKFRSLTSSYYRGTEGIVLVYDVTKRSTFESIGMWLTETETYSSNPHTVKLLVGNQIDKPNRQVSHQEGSEFARSKGMVFIETSAKTKVGIQQTFEELVQKILDTPELLSKQQNAGTAVDATQPAAPDGGMGGCCY
eukprot:TRINITY_DN13655_c0_g1_i1.p1 TRINITY_DN13655_c0_g1~~TRINITY_DN13655_c0_g1_i1.p1  ORF type:complete len:206 (+),score=46.62 TRINITY_DN13655_c0_g1_i1:50-667(+)